MRDPITPQQFTRVAVVAFLAFAAVVAVIHSRQGRKVSLMAPVEQRDADATSSELARCRTIMPDQTEALENCRLTWAANRKHFFAPAKPMRLLEEPVSSAVTGPPKSQDRVTPIEPQSEAR